MSRRGVCRPCRKSRASWATSRIPAAAVARPGQTFSRRTRGAFPFRKTKSCHRMPRRRWPHASAPSLRPCRFPARPIYASRKAAHPQCRATACQSGRHAQIPRAPAPAARRALCVLRTPSRARRRNARRYRTPPATRSHPWSAQSPARKSASGRPQSPRRAGESSRRAVW